MNRAQVPVDQLGAFASGLLDVIFAFSLALEGKGVLARSEIVDVLRTVEAQVSAQEGSQPGRKIVVELMLQAFELPVAGDQVRDPGGSSTAIAPRGDATVEARSAFPRRGSIPVPAKRQVAMLANGMGSYNFSAWRGARNSEEAISVGSASSSEWVWAMTIKGARRGTA